MVNHLGSNSAASTTVQRSAGGRCDGRRGVALMEAIIASIILGVALAFMVSMSTTAVKTQTEGEALQTAAMLADEQLNMVLARGVDEYAKRFPVSGNCDAPFQRFRYELAIKGGGDVQASDVIVTISWPTTTGDRSINIATAIAGRPGETADPDRQPATTVTRPQ